MWRLFCHYLFLISPSFGASGRLCFVIVTFSGYTHTLGSISLIFVVNRRDFVSGSYKFTSVNISKTTGRHSRQNNILLQY